MRHIKRKKTRLPRKVKKRLNLQGVKYSDYIKALDQTKNNMKNNKSEVDKTIKGDYNKLNKDDFEKLPKDQFDLFQSAEVGLKRYTNLRAKFSISYTDHYDNKKSD